jgi:hypothetical protein
MNMKSAKLYSSVQNLRDSLISLVFCQYLKLKSKDSVSLTTLGPKIKLAEKGMPELQLQTITFNSSALIAEEWNVLFGKNQ